MKPISVIGTLMTFAGLGVFFLGYLALAFDTTISKDDWALGSLIIVGFMTTIWGLILTFKKEKK